VDKLNVDRRRSSASVRSGRFPGVRWIDAHPHRKLNLIAIGTVVGQERELLRAAVPGQVRGLRVDRAPIAVPKKRVTAQRKLCDFVDLYHRRSDLMRIRDFQVQTHGRSVDEAAREVVERPAGARVRYEPRPTAARPSTTPREPPAQVGGSGACLCLAGLCDDLNGWRSSCRHSPAF